MSADQFEWEERGQKEAEDFTPVISFKEMGQAVVGKYLGTKDVPDGKFGPETHYQFQSRDGKFAINPNPDLKKRYSVIKVGDIVRTTWVGEKDVGQPTPMKVFRCEVAKKKATPAAGAPVPTPPPAPKADSGIPF